MLSDIQGQEEGVFFLRKVVDKKITSPLLLIGDQGVGRRFSVIQAAKEMFCLEERQSNCQCSSCYQITRLQHPDVSVISVPAGKHEIGVEAIRQMLESTYSSPSVAPYRIVILDGADCLTPASANALLKTLEEPPPSTKFFLLAESFDRVIDTIRSRCGRVRYGRLPESFIISTLQAFEKDPVKSLVYGRIAEGSVGRAIQYWGANRLKLRDQVCTLLESGVGRDLSALFAGIDEIEKDLTLSLKLLEHLLHDLLIIRLNPSRLINLDLLERLTSMCKSGQDRLWISLRAELKSVHQKHESSYINLPFHLKSAFVNTFFVG